MIDEPDRDAKKGEFASPSDAERITTMLGAYTSHKTVRAGQIVDKADAS
jgi:hypothetical protein